MSAWFGRADDVLRGRPLLVESESAARAFVNLLGMIIVFGLAYGVAMGTFSGVSNGHGLQLVYSAVKVPLLLLVTFLLSIPSFFVLNSLLGVRGDFGESLRALMATQAGLTVVLVALVPMTLFWYASFENYQGAILFNAAVFGVASLSAQLLLRRHYRPLIKRNPVHRWLMRLWLVIFAFVGIQMGWTLRPFIGDPGQPPTFLRRDALGNAYEAVWRMILNLLR